MSTVSAIWEAWARSISALPIGGFLQALSLPISMVVAWLTFRATSANLRHSLIVSDVSSQIKEFATLSRELSLKVEQHYLGKYTEGFSAGAAKESRNQILASIKCLDDKRAVLGVFLSKKKTVEMEQKFDEWQHLVLGESFPVTRKEERCKEYEKPVVDLKKAQSAFDCYLATLRKSCIDAGWRFQKTLR